MSKLAENVVKYSSQMKWFANAGIGAVVAGYLLIYTIPSAQKSFTDALERQQEMNREDRREARTHGTEAARELGTAIREQTEALEAKQNKGHENQERMIEAVTRVNETLRKMDEKQ